MAEPAIGRMRVDEFLHWDDGTDRRYELVDGVIVAMAPPARAHGILAARLGGAIDAALRDRRPCMAQTEAGIVRPGRDDVFFVADVAATSAPLRPGDQLAPDPFLIVEILSPSTMIFDRNTKVPEYRRTAGVQEILLLDSETAFAEVLRRDSERWITEIVQGTAAILSLTSVPLMIAMSELYDGLLPSGRPDAAETA